MKHALPPALVQALQRLRRRRTLVAFDFDGTLAPIAADRRAARLRPATRALLACVCARYPCAVISGRGLADLRRRLRGVPARHLVGNHGIEPSAGMAGFRRTIAAARRQLAAALAGWPDIDVEDKVYSLALHYRRSRRRTGARRAIVRALAALPVPLRVVAGKLVVNAMPRGAPDKGAALRALCRQERAAVALYVGDDVTDEDVFALERPSRLLTLRVGRSRRSRAQAFLKDQHSVDALLGLLAALRAPPATARRPARPPLSAPRRSPGGTPPRRRPPAAPATSRRDRSSARYRAAATA